ncbi:hypothetical protein ACFPU0_13730 [Pseudomonas sp. GCM10022186]|uniref:hypothetical protein n=1 Tax=Pseudomonas sp. GCM10022186 TaxID=3252650 RepID=UPI0036094BF6
MGLSIRALAACCLIGSALSAPAPAAQVQLRGHWLQPLDDEDSFVAVLSRDEDGDAVAAELHLEAFRDGLALGEEVHRIALPEAVRLFALPLEEEVDCYRVIAVVGLDAAGDQVSAEDGSMEPEECEAPELLPVGASRPS